MVADDTEAFSPSIGDYAAVIYSGKIYPAIVGDAGPSNKIGEASARICKELNPKASGLSRAVSNIKVSYLVFPGTAEKPGPPDLVHWREKCKQFLDEMGGTTPELFTLERHRSFLAYTYAHRNTYVPQCHCYQLLLPPQVLLPPTVLRPPRALAPASLPQAAVPGATAVPSATANSGAFAVSFTNPISGTKASRSFDGDRAATRPLPSPNVSPSRAVSAQGRRLAHSLVLLRCLR